MESEPSNSLRETPLANIASGCLYAVYVVGLSAGLLFLNSLFCTMVYAFVPKLSNEQMASRAGQLFFFVVPLILLIVEWNLLDRVRRLFRPNLTASQPMDRNTP